MGLKVTIEKKREGVYVISLAGSLDSVTCSECEEKVQALLGPPTKALIFDMEVLDYISSIGFAVFIKAKQALEKNNGILAVTNLKPQVKRIFDMMKIVPYSIFVSMKDVEDYLEKHLIA